MEQFSLPGPADLPWVDEQIAQLQRGFAAASAPRKTPPLPHLSNQPTKGPPLTQEITDAFTVCWAFFTMQELVMEAPLIADTLMRQRFASFLSTYWVYLDDKTRSWIVRTPALWDLLISAEIAKRRW